MIATSYRYKVDALLILENENIPIRNESIMAITIDSNYDLYNRPIIYLSLNIQSKVYDKLVLNSETASINLRIRKMNSSGGSSLSKKYIHDSFSYLIKSDPDYYRGLKDKIRTEDVIEEDEYMSGTIALFRKDSLDKIKQLHCNIFRNTNMASIIHRYTKNRKMIIEPFDSNNKFDTVIVPPMESLTEVLSFLNDFDALYDRKYRYFEDFDVTYLLSGTGNSIKGMDEFNTFIIDIVDITDEKSKIPGIVIDSNKSAYLLYIDAQNTSMDIDNTKSIEYDSILGVSSSGEVYKVPLNSMNKNNKSEKYLIQRVYNDNSRIINNLKYAMDSTSIILQVSKSEVDGSLFTPNKEYFINNYKELTKYNGKFLLSYKKEIIVQQDSEFISNIILGFRKIVE